MLQTRDTRIEEAAETCLDELVRDRDIALSSEDPVAPQAELAASIRHCLDDASARDLLLWWTKGTGRVRSAKIELWARRARAGGQVVGRPSDHLPTVEEGRIELDGLSIPERRARPAIDALIESLVAAPTVGKITASLDVLRWKLGSRLAHHFHRWESQPASSRRVAADPFPPPAPPRTGESGPGSPPAEVRAWEVARGETPPEPDPERKERSPGISRARLEMRLSATPTPLETDEGVALD